VITANTHRNIRFGAASFSITVAFFGRLARDALLTSLDGCATRDRGGLP